MPYVLRICLFNLKIVSVHQHFDRAVQKARKTEFYAITFVPCTIASKINVTPKVVYLPISKLQSILAVAYLLAHNNKSQIYYCGQISLQSAAVNSIFSDNVTPLGVTFILLVMIHGTNIIGIKVIGNYPSYKHLSVLTLNCS